MASLFLNEAGGGDGIWWRRPLAHLATIYFHAKLCPLAPVQRINELSDEPRRLINGNSSSSVGGTTHICSRPVGRRASLHPPG